MGRLSSLSRIHQEAELVAVRMGMDSEFAITKAAPYLASVAGVGAISRPYEQAEQQNQHEEQYRHYRGWVYTAIKTIANRLAGQAFYMGRSLNGKKPSKGKKLFMPGATDTVPSHVKAHLLATDVEVVQEHELLSALRAPKEHMVAWALMYCYQTVTRYTCTKHEVGTTRGISSISWMGVATDWPVSRASTSRGLPYVARRNLNLRKHHSGGLTVPAFASQM